MRVKSFKMYCTIILIAVLANVFLVGNAFGYQVVINLVQDAFIDEMGATDVNGSSYFMVTGYDGTSFKLNTLVEFDLSTTHFRPYNMYNDACLMLDDQAVGQPPCQ